MFTLQELLPIQYPLIQGGMAQVSDASLAVAVSEAGGLGVIAAGGRQVDELIEYIREAKKMTDKPFAVNFALAYPNAEEAIKAAMEEGIEYAILGGGNPKPYFGPLSEAGIFTIPVIGNAKMAKKVQEMGAKACIFEGAEAGGHIGSLNTMAALPHIVDSVDIPVISAGGIGTGRQVLAAEILGAAGVQMGTRFLAAKECTVHDKYKEAVIAATDADNVVTGYSAHPVRGLKNKMTDEYLELEWQGGKQKEMEELGTGANRRAAREGDVEYGSIMAGQTAVYVTGSESVAEIFEKVWKEYEETKAKICK